MPIEQSTPAVVTSPLVSAIVSAYNAERFIRGCLEDLEAQTIANRLEIIVVDSGSSQNEWTIVREFQQRYDNIVYIRTARRESIYAAWNRGIQAARGTYITNANTDDRHKRDAFERMVTILETRPDIALVYANVFITETENETFETHTPVGRFNWRDFDRLQLIYDCFMGPQPMWRKRMHATYGYFDESFEVAGDWEFWLRMAENETFLHLREFLGLYLSSPAGIENRNQELLGQENLRVYQRYVHRADQLTNAAAISDATAAKPSTIQADQRTNAEAAPSASLTKPMTITAYKLYDRAAVMQPASAEPDADAAPVAPSADRAMRAASGAGWVLRCPHAFEATWNGDPHPEDIAIQLDATDGDAPAFVQSNLGSGLLTFYSGYQMQTTAPDRLWVRGPINWPKDGLYPLEQIVDTSLPATITMSWRFTRANQRIRFEAGEPFCAIVPYPSQYADQFACDVVELDDDGAVLEQALQELIQAPDVQAIFQRLQAAAAPAEPPPPASAPQETAARWAAQLSDPPPVSCICPTYGRAELLEEAIHSFLQQDYPGQKELIVLNDYDQQTLEFEHPEVRIVNVPKRFSSVGEKYKAAAALCTHDLIVVWHDDDIYLPHRLSFSVAHFNQRRGFFKANSAWFWNDGQLSGPDRNTFHGGSCFSRELFTETQGYPHVGNGYDIEFELLCEELRTGATRSQQVQPEDVYYIYRWGGTGSYHFSVSGQNGQGHDAVAVHVREQTERGQIKHGHIRLVPHWKSDYSALVRNYLDNGHVKPAEAIVPFPPPFFAIPGPEPMDEAAAAQLFRGTHPARISVVLPALNESVLLQRTVEQFEATLPANCEIIVVDNGSTDGSADFLADRDCNCKTVSLIQSAKPLGVAGARNRGLAAARGEVIVFADAHIDLPANWWQPVVSTLNRPNVGVVGPGIGVMGKPEHNVAYAQRIAEPNLRVEWLGWQQREPYPVPSLGGGFMAMRRETLECAGAFDPGMSQWGSEDLELCVRYWLLGHEVWVVPDVTILHYFRTENPLKVKPGIVTHNQLRVALLHFSQERIARVVSALKTQGDFGQAIAHAVDSDAWQRRAEFAARRVRDDDWFFEQFKDTCPV